jgi:hypothetical protein
MHGGRLRSHHLLLPGMGLFHVFLLLNLISPLLGNPQISNCDLCMNTTQAVSTVTRTLLFHTYYSCAVTVIGSCIQNHTTYYMCSHGNQHICFNSTYCPQDQWLEVRSFHNTGDLIDCTKVSDYNKPVPLYFDVCAVIAKTTTIWGHCGSLAWEGPIC